MAIQNTLYGKDLSESEASQNYQVKSPTLTKLAALTLPSTGNYHLALNQEGTDFVFISPATTTDAVSEGSTNLYFTSSRARAAITGAISDLTATNLTASRALVSDATGKVSASTVTSTEIGYVAGATSAIQTQLNTITGRTITAGSGMTGGGNLSSNISIGLSFNTSTSDIKMNGAVTLGVLTTIPRADHVHPSDTTKVSTSLMATPNGVATLDSNAKVPISQVPAITTTVGFGGEIISVPYTGTNITLPLPINQGGTGTTTSTGALSALGGQPLSPILTTISTNNGAGFLVKDSAGIAQVRSIKVNNPLIISNGTGVSGDPTLSLNQGDGSGLDADMLDGAHGSAYFKVDGTVTYSTGTAETIRSSINAASTGANADITSLSTIKGLGNTSNNHITITSSGLVGVGDSNPALYGKVAIRGGMADTANSSLALLVSDGAVNRRSDLALYSTLFSGADVSVKRAADIVAGFTTSALGSEYLSFHVGGATASRLLTTERVRIDGSGNLLVGTTTSVANGGVVQLSRGITFPSTTVPSTNVNTLDDYAEGTWVPSIDSAIAGSGRVTTVHYAAYTKVGNLLTFSAYVTLSTLGTNGSGNLIITGLPYTPASGSLAYSSVVVSYFASLKAPLVYLSANVLPSTAVIYFRGIGAASTECIKLDFNSYVQVASAFILSGFYYTA
jgi:hypothetical protein